MKISAHFPFKKPVVPLDERREVLRREYLELLERLSDIRRNFDFVEEPSCADALIFEENAVVLRLERLLGEAKAQGLSIEFHEMAKK